MVRAGRRCDLRARATAAALAVAAALVWPRGATAPPQPPSAPQPRVLPSESQAAALYAAAWHDLRAWRTQQAQQRLEQVVALVPDFAPGHRALAQTLRGARALAEAERALALAGGLPERDRLEIEAFAVTERADYDRGAELYEALAVRFPDDLQYWLSAFYANVGASRLDEARRVLDRARENARGAADEVEVEMAEAHLAAARGDFRTAQAAAARAGVRARAAGSKVLEARALDSEQYCLSNLGEPDRTREAVEALRRLRLELGDEDGAVRTLQHLAGLAVERGELAEGRRLYDEVIAYFRPRGFEAIYTALGFTAELELRRGRLADADVAATELYTRTPPDPDRRWVAYQHMLRGRRAAAAGDLDAARTNFVAADALWRGLDDHLTVATMSVELGRVLTAQGELALARVKLEEGHTILRTLGIKRWIAESQLALAELALAEGHPESAEPLAREARTELTRQGALDGRALAAAAEARALTALGRTAEATAILAPELARVSESAEVRTRLAIASGDQARIAAVLDDDRAAGLAGLERDARRALD